MNENFENIDRVIKMLSDYLPNGYFLNLIAEQLEINKKESGSIQRVLEQERIITDFGTHGMVILTQHGENIAKLHGGIEEYFREKNNRIQQDRIAEINKNEKLSLDLKLSKWHVKTYWYFAAIAVFSGFFSLFSIIRECTTKSLQQEIEAVLRQRESLIQHKNETSNGQTHSNTINGDGQPHRGNTNEITGREYKRQSGFSFLIHYIS